MDRIYLSNRKSQFHLERREHVDLGSLPLTSAGSRHCISRADIQQLQSALREFSVRGSAVETLQRFERGSWGRIETHHCPPCRGC